MKLTDIGKFCVQCADQLLRLAWLNIKSAGIGQDDAFVMEAQVHRVGTEPVAVACSDIAFTKQAEGPEWCRIQPEFAGEHVFKNATGAARQAATGEQGFQSGCGEFAKGELVSRLGPDQFGNKQSETHGEWGQARGEGRRSVA